MGLSFISSTSICSCEKLPNPNPSNFVIKKVAEFGRYVIALVNYPDCKNYEGNKIMIFKGISSFQLQQMDFIDPHFCDKHLSPIARFEPTDRGWEMAKKFVRAI